MHIVHSSFGLHTDSKCFITDEVIAGICSDMPTGGDTGQAR